MHQLCLCVLVLVACSSSPDTAVASPREEVLRQVMSDADNCFLDRAEYCIGDEAFINAIIDERLEALEGGTMPTMRRAVDRFARRVSSRYRAAQLETEEVRAQVHARMEALYAEPPISVGGAVVTIDAGWVPVGLVSSRNRWALSGADSPYLESYQPRTQYIARQLLRARALHPAATEIRLEARSNRGTSRVRTEVSWHPGADVVWVGRSRTNKSTGPNLERLLDGTVSLVDDVDRCYEDDGSSRDPRCR